MRKKLKNQFFLDICNPLNMCPKQGKKQNVTNAQNLFNLEEKSNGTQLNIDNKIKSDECNNYITEKT